ncbi:MAG: cysteine hydrolase family protein [Nitrospinota bacterium]
MKDETALAQWVDPSSSALIVIDVQNDFCHSEGSFAKKGLDVSLAQAVLPNLRRLMDEARSVGAPVIIFRVARSPHNEWPAKARLERLNFGPDVVPTAVEGTWGAELCEGFEPKPGDILMTKNRYGGFTGTNLDLTLRNLGVKTLIMTGIATNVCVESTAREGFMLDYNIVMVDDACATTTRELHEGTLASVRAFFGRVVSVDEVLAAWAERGALARK